MIYMENLSKHEIIIDLLEDGKQRQMMECCKDFERLILKRMEFEIFRFVKI